MKAKSHKIFKEGIADEVGVHQSVVDEIISFYYGKVRNALSSLDDNRVYIENLGTFAIRKSRLEKAIIKNKSFLGNLQKQTYTGYNKSIETEKKIKNLEDMLSKIESIIIEKQNFKNEINKKNI
jgi:nucleoid DNA-binding protein